MLFEINNICEIRVRYAETDKMGFVYNGNYLTYFEVARVEMMRAYGMPYYKLEKAGYQLPLVESHVNYKSPAYFDDLLKIEAVLKFEMKPLMKIEYNIYRGDSTITTGYTVHSFYNIITKKPARPPKVFVDAFTGLINK